MASADIYKQELEQIRNEFEEFAYIISHDFKAPIRAISNLSYWIEEDLGDSAPEEVQQNLKILRNRTKRMEGMVDALLHFSRAGRTGLELAECDLNRVLNEITASYAGTIDLNIPEPLPVFVTYALKLRQVFDILIANCETFSNRPLTKVTVTHRLIGNGYYEFIVSDNGPGVPDNALEKIFTLFYTVSSKDSVDTIGAGLAISKKIIQFVQGSITAENNLENGLTIRFTWPQEIF